MFSKRNATTIYILNNDDNDYDEWKKDTFGGLVGCSAVLRLGYIINP